MKLVRGEQIDFVAASHEDANEPGVFKKVLATRADILAGRVQMINWARLPRGSQFQSHYHEDMQECFIILNGRVVMTVDGQSQELGDGDMIVIDPREVHQMRNACDEDVLYLVIGVTTDQGGQTVVVD